MTSVRGALLRLGIGQTRVLREEVADLRELALQTRAMTAQIREVVMGLNEIVGTLNHEVHHGMPSGLPLFVGVAERLRTDAEAAVGAAETIDRQLRRIEARLGPAPTSSEPHA